MRVLKLMIEADSVHYESSKCTALGFFFFHLGCWEISLPRQVSELWLLGSESWSQLTRLSMGLKSLLGYTAEFQMSGMIFLQSRDTFGSTIVSHGQKQKEQYPSCPIMCDVTSQLHEGRPEKDRPVGGFLITLMHFLNHYQPPSRSPIYGQWSSSRLWI